MHDEVLYRILHLQTVAEDAALFSLAQNESGSPIVYYRAEDEVDRMVAEVATSAPAYAFTNPIEYDDTSRV